MTTFGDRYTVLNSPLSNFGSLAGAGGDAKEGDHAVHQLGLPRHFSRFLSHLPSV